MLHAPRIRRRCRRSGYPPASLAHPYLDSLTSTRDLKFYRGGFGLCGGLGVYGGCRVDGLVSSSTCGQAAHPGPRPPVPVCLAGHTGPATPSRGRVSAPAPPGKRHRCHIAVAPAATVSHRCRLAWLCDSLYSAPNLPRNPDLPRSFRIGRVSRRLRAWTSVAFAQAHALLPQLRLQHHKPIYCTSRFTFPWLIRLDGDHAARRPGGGRGKGDRGDDRGVGDGDDYAGAGGRGLG